jgi:hypothetical protein
MSKDQEEAYENLRIAEQINVWQAGPIGRYVDKLLEVVERRILDSFETVDVTNIKKTQKLQFALREARAAPRWLDEAVRLGIQAEQKLRGEREEYDE